jgi:hypothetical protein
VFGQSRIDRLEEKVEALESELRRMKQDLTFYLPTANAGMFNPSSKELTLKEAVRMMVNHFGLKYESQPETQCLVSDNAKTTEKKGA